MTLFLVTIFVLCPILFCPATADSHSCCHKNPPKTVPDCPYSILEKSKANPNISHVSLGVTAVTCEKVNLQELIGYATTSSAHIVTSDRIFLRNRVLLI